jgi:drug/metabolite transporter (DMT)-like permease
VNTSKKNETVSHASPHPSAAPRGMVAAAFAAVYLIWGATYLGIRYAIETIPPFFMGGGRFVLAGLALFIYLRIKGTPIPPRVHWINAAIVGALLFGVGNGGVNWAEQKVPSSRAALMIAATPFWFALMDWFRPKGVRPHFQTLIGILVGFSGMVLLAGWRGNLHQDAIDHAGTMALMLATICWAAGSLYARYTPKPENPLMGVALQMILGGAILFLMGLAGGETAKFAWSNVSARSALAFAFLTLIGSLIGFTAYSWLLKVTTPARVSTYAYVNPVIAVFLGWAIGGETLTTRMLWAAAVILLGVVIITTRRTPAEPLPPANEARPMSEPSATKI